MMAPQTLLFVLSVCSIMSFPNCDAQCTPSACGIVRNISSPFRLKDDPLGCGDLKFELACENNVTFLYLSSSKYYVKEIDYLSSTIRLVDSSLNDDDICSFPNSSAYAYHFPYSSSPNYKYPYFTKNYSGYPYDDVARPINLLSCPHPLNDSSLFSLDFSHCAISSSNSFHPRFAYIKVGHVNASDLTDMCSVEMIVLTSWRFKDLNNISLLEIHHSLLYGFDLFICSFCGDLNPLVRSGIREKLKGFFIWYSPFFLVIVGLLCAGVSPPVMTILGFAAVSLLGYSVIVPFIGLIYHVPIKDFSLLVLIIEFAILAPRVIGFPLALWLFIYKFRRRRLSMYNAIESFLQNNNKLMPIRYSYSNIKKITRGFQDELGEGGYGSVYKGKLQSGHDVAVKLLKRCGENDQDFMNEIATIGRIHHVNIIKLVGYCAQGSKRALIFDFMPNGSLDKYLFNREKMSSLNLGKKFEIAVGVARGIEYLHRGCDVQILHFDIKPHNILLDDKFIPKISDFGLAKFCSTEKNAVTLTTARGTIGYVAPELLNRSLGRVSYKADVYSFGMLLMEMVSLKGNLRGNNDGSSKYFPCWIYDYLNQGKDIEIGEADENDNDDDERKLVRKMTMVELWCIQMSPDNRPSMNKVLEMLEGDLERLQLPEYSYESTQVLISSEDQMETTCSSDSASLLHHGAALPNLKITVQ